MHEKCGLMAPKGEGFDLGANQKQGFELQT